MRGKKTVGITSPVAENIVKALRENPPVKIENNCYWPCPCGGQTPNPPEDCEHKVRMGPHKPFCVDASICRFCCDKAATCPAFGDK